MACSSPFLRPALLGSAVLLAFCLLGACSQVVNIGRDSDAQGAARLNPFNYVVKYDIDPAIVLDYPRRICIGGVAVAADAEKTEKNSDALPDKETQAPDKPDVAELVRRSFVAHALLRLEELDIAATVAPSGGDEIDAAVSNCPYLLSAVLLKNDEFYTLFWSRRRIGIELRLTEVDSEQTLWTAQHVSSRNEAAMPLDPVGLAVAIFRAQDFAKDADIVPSMVDDVMRRLFAAFPVLPKSDDEPPANEPSVQKPPGKSPAQKIETQEARSAW